MANASVVVDASAVIAHFLATDRHHAAATHQLERAVTAVAPLLIHPLTLAECLVGAARQGRVTERRAAIRSLGIQLTTPDLDAPVRLADLRASTGLRLPDCCVLDVAVQSGASLLSFDDRLRAAARTLSVQVV